MHLRRDPYERLPQIARGPRGGMTERVERALRERIVDLTFRPGEFIDKSRVCEQLGVSRFPVSEALGRLAGEGLVEVLPQRGTRVARIHLPRLYEAMLIRRSLEAAVAEEAARSLPAAALDALDRNLAEQEGAVRDDDRARFHRLDLAFHDELVTALSLARVGAVIESSRANIDRVRRLLSSPRRHAVTLDEHRRLLGALQAREPSAARAAMEAHLDAVREELDHFCAAHPEVFEDERA